MMKYEEKIPVFVLTGFLGSGKTTLLKSLLQSEAFGETAVLINEFGEVGLDQYLVGDVPVENVILDNGCICCSIRGDLLEAITSLYSKRHRGEIPHFNRLVIETTGLANPAPIIATILNEPKLRNHFQIRKIITTVDVVNINQHMLNDEWMSQITAADYLLLTKTDLVTDESQSIMRLLKTYNSVASIINVQDAITSPEQMMSESVLNVTNKLTEFRSFKPTINDNLKPIFAGASSLNVPHSHNGISSFCVVLEKPIDWPIFGIWLSMLLNRHGREILRIKAILNIRDSQTPVILHGVQHLIHPPEHIEEWPDSDRNSKIIFILRELEKKDIERSLNIFLDKLVLPHEN
jgi:G3E family GTPase